MTHAGAVFGAVLVLGMVALGLAGVFRTPKPLPDNTAAIEAMSRGCMGTFVTRILIDGSHVAECTERHQPLPELVPQVTPEKDPKGKFHLKSTIGGK